MTLLRILTLMSLIGLSLSAQGATPQKQWSSRMAVGKDQTFLLRKILPHPMGGTVVFGALDNNLTFKQEIRAQSLQANGSIQWSKGLPAVSSAISVHLADAAISSETGYFVLNNINYAGAGDQTDALLSYLNAQGDVVWQQKYAGDTQLSNYGQALQADAKGGVVVAGIDTVSVSDAGIETLCFIRHHDRQGALLWSTSVAGLDNCSISSFGPSMVFDREGHLYLALENAVVKLDTQGQELWRVNGRAFSLSLFQDNIYVTSPQKTWALSSDGTILWEVDNQGGLYLHASALGIISATTEFDESGSGSRIRLMSFSLDGTLRWSRPYTKGAKSFAHGLSVNTQGEILVFGEVWTRMGLLKIPQAETVMLGFNAEGEDLWQVTAKGSTSGVSFFVEADDGFYLGDLTGLVTRYGMGQTPTPPPAKCPWYNPFCKK